MPFSTSKSVVGPHIMSFSITKISKNNIKVRTQWGYVLFQVHNVMPKLILVYLRSFPENTTYKWLRWNEFPTNRFILAVRIESGHITKSTDCEGKSILRNIRMNFIYKTKNHAI